MQSRDPESRDPGIPDRFLIPKSRDYERPNPGISGLENSVLTLLLRVKCMHYSQNKTMQNNYPVLKPKNTLNEHRGHFATALIVPYYQLQFVIVHRI